MKPAIGDYVQQQNRTQRRCEWAHAALFTHCMSASLLAHLHAMLEYFKVPRRTERSFFFFFFFVLLWKHVTHSKPSPGAASCNRHAGHAGTSHAEGLSHSSRRLYFEGLSDRARTANMAVSSLRPRVEAMSVSEMNHSTSPEPPPPFWNPTLRCCSEAGLHLLYPWSSR